MGFLSKGIVRNLPSIGDQGSGQITTDLPRAVALFGLYLSGNGRNDAAYT